MLVDIVRELLVQKRAGLFCPCLLPPGFMHVCAQRSSNNHEPTMRLLDFDDLYSPKVRGNMRKPLNTIGLLIVK